MLFLQLLPGSNIYMNTLRKRRLIWIILLILCSVLAAFLVVKALRQNVNLFYTPTQLATVEVNIGSGRAVRIGGMVQKGSVMQGKDLNIEFVVTDFSHSVTVQYSGMLPDLFKEGQGVVVLGHLQNKIFYADQVLAKHDENYMPPGVKINDS